MSYPILSETKAIIGLLESEGATAVAEDVKHAFYGTCVNIELLMGVKFYLAKMPANAVSPSTMYRIKTLLAEIDKILQR